LTSFIRNAWYAACWADELGATPLARKLLGEEIALFRTESGEVGAVEDCCPHRFAPLSLGAVEGENIVCGYHGMEFGCDGVCVAIPGQENVPDRARLRAYPAFEQNSLMWVWMGDPEQADRSLLPDVHWIGDPKWRSVTGTTRYECNWILLVDNLIDLSHTTFVHKSTIGTDDVADTPVETVRDGDIVTVTRQMNDTEPSIFYKNVGAFDGKVDRWQKIWLEPPSTVIIDAGAVPAGSNDQSRGIDTRIISVLNPVDDRTVDQLWAFSRDFALEDDQMDAEIEKSILHTFEEDVVFLAGQQKNMERQPNRKMLNNPADAGVVHARRVINKFLAAEAG